MSERSVELMLRAEHLAHDIQSERDQHHPDSLDYQLLDKALPLAITVGLFLKGSTEEFKEQMEKRTQ